MATYALTAEVTALVAAWLPYADGITHDTATTQANLILEATLALHEWGDARLALININASAASSYSSGIGSSAQKRARADAQSAVDLAWKKFADLCAQGSQDDLPEIRDDSIAYWDLS